MEFDSSRRHRSVSRQREGHHRTPFSKAIRRLSRGEYPISPPIHAAIPTIPLPTPPAPSGGGNVPCEVCENSSVPIYYCENCDGTFCDDCWPGERAHRPGKKGPYGPHEKADRAVVNRIKGTFSPLSAQAQEQLHQEDEDTTWFGIARDEQGRSELHDFGRYATLMTNSVTNNIPLRYPHLVSFIGQTGAGKSTLVKMLVERKTTWSGGGSNVFPSPVVGSVATDVVPTSGDVHLYADPETYREQRPVLYADCEGFEGGEKLPVATQLKAARKAADASDSHGRQKSKWLSRSKRAIAWADTPETQKRQYAVMELYPRLLYTFSDVIVFVLRNPKVFESSVLGKLLSWASAAIEMSTNQPVLPHAIIALNATDLAISQTEWDVKNATENLISSVDDALSLDFRYREYVDYWTDRGREIRNAGDLLRCYYSSVRVVRIPQKGRSMLLDSQVAKLQQEITRACLHSYDVKRRARMLSNSDEMHLYLQAAFDHFSRDLSTPFNFMEIAIKQNPIPPDFGGNIVKLAIALRDNWENIDGSRIFAKLSYMVASCILLDITRHGLKGRAEELLIKYYQECCEDVLDDFCALFWPCEFENKAGRCVNVREGHEKGHQNAKGKVIGAGAYESTFTFEGYRATWLKSLFENIRMMQRRITNRLSPRSKTRESDEITKQHRRILQSFYNDAKGAHRFISHSACYCCLREMPEHPLPCGHVLCSACVRAYCDSPGEPKHTQHKRVIIMHQCPLHLGYIKFTAPWTIKLKPTMAGVRILSLDGGGIRGIAELEALRAIEEYLGGKLPIQAFFDLIVGTSTGGIIAMGLGVENWSVETCIAHFKRLVDRAFSPGVPTLLGMRYRSGPFEEALQEVFKDEFMFGGHHDEASSYHVKVAITATNEQGNKPVIFTNYNRQAESQASYSLVRPDDPGNELKLWEVLRATSAAPLYFKPLRNRKTKEGYVDGALYHNNPVRVASHESKLLWPEVQSLSPDVLLSIGTGHNGEETSGLAEPYSVRDRRFKADSDIIVHPIPRERKPAFTGMGWFKNSVQNVTVAMNRVDNILNSEQTWADFRNEIVSVSHNDRRRYHRINPKLGFQPPKLDKKGKLEKVQTTVRDVLKGNPSYRKKISRIAHRLVASSFYFEMMSNPTYEAGVYVCRGHLRCKFENGSQELRHLADFMQLHQRIDLDFSPQFYIYEQGRDTEVRSMAMEPRVITNMRDMNVFNMSPVEIHVSENCGTITISLALLDKTEQEQVCPISGFPRRLVQPPTEEAPAVRLSTPSQLNVRRRERTEMPSPYQNKDWPEDERPLSIADLMSEQEQQDGLGIQVAGHPWQLPDLSKQRANWLDRRTGYPDGYLRAANRHPLPHYQEDDENALPSLRATGLAMQPITSGLPSSTAAGPSDPGHDSPDDEDEDEKALKVAIERSLMTSNPRYTANGTNLDELAYALRISAEEND